MIHTEPVVPGATPTNCPAQQQVYPTLPAAPRYTDGPAFKAITPLVMQETADLLKKVKAIAETSVEKINEQAQARAQVRQERASDQAPFWRSWWTPSYPAFNIGNQTEVHHHHYNQPTQPEAPQSQEVKKEEDEKTKRKWAVGLGFILAGVAAYLYGAAVARFEDITDEYNELSGLIRKWDDNKVTYLFSFARKIDAVQTRALGIVERRYNNQVYKTAYYASIFFASIFAITGGVFASKLLIAIGLYQGLVSTVAFLGRLGYLHYSQRDSKDAQFIRDNLAQLQVG